MKKKLYVLGFAISSIALTFCGSQKNSGTSGADGTSLKDVFKKDFLIGTALNTSQINERDAVSAALVAKEFNVLTPENIMKSEEIQPQMGQFNFENADKLIALAEKNKQKVVGHTLVWHSQLPQYVRRMKSADSLRMFVTNHINTVAGRYDKKLLGWDVVNEALNEDGSMRKSIFLELMGPDFVTEAFRMAQKATPNSELYYNDYNNEQPKKRAGALRIVKQIKDAGVRIDGVGIQGHWHVGRVPFKEIEESILAYHALGVQVMITELDIEVLPRNFTGADVGQRMANDPANNPYVNGLPDSVSTQLAKDYEQLFKLFVKHADKISRVTFWGVNDGDSWLNGWPVRGRTNYPLLFDRANNPKPAYYSVISVKK